MDILEKAKKIKHNNEREWLAISEVVSVGIGYVQEKEMGIIIGVKNKKKSIVKKIPAQIDGVKIEIKTVNELRAL